MNNNDNNIQVNSTVELNNTTQQPSKRDFQSTLGFIFSVSSLILFILSIGGIFLIQFRVNGFVNTVFFSIVIISFYLVPIFSSNGLVLCLLNLKKSKLSIIGFVISLLIVSIQLFFLLFAIFILVLGASLTNLRI